jgi:hypothetical protein
MSAAVSGRQFPQQHYQVPEYFREHPNLRNHSPVQLQMDRIERDLSSMRRHQRNEAVNF